MAPAASRSLFVSVRRRALPCPEHDVPVKTWASGDGAGVALDWTPGSGSRGVEALCGHVRHGRERWYGAESADSSLARKWRPRQAAPRPGSHPLGSSRRRVDDLKPLHVPPRLAVDRLANPLRADSGGAQE